MTCSNCGHYLASMSQLASLVRVSLRTAYLLANSCIRHVSEISGEFEPPVAFLHKLASQEHGNQGGRPSWPKLNYRDRSKRWLRELSSRGPKTSAPAIANSCSRGSTV
jgi:hypothetical protein